jgi:short-chain Z-isoprenyl diphosphate synthase
VIRPCIRRVSAAEHGVAVRLREAPDTQGPRLLTVAVRAWVREALTTLYERRLARSVLGVDTPRHVGVIIDGNRRWAKSIGLEDVNDGHRVGAEKIADLLRWCDEAGVEVVTLFLLSTDNLQRPEPELTPLLRIIEGVACELAEPGRNWTLRAVGALELLPAETVAVLKEAEEDTRDRPGASVNLAVGYGGRREIADAVRSLLAEHAERGTTLPELVEVLDVEHIAEHLYTRGQPDPDLVIRTSGEQRLSGFLLWQTAHSEFYFTDVYWPEFRRVDFLRALRDYAARNRRFGG